NRCTFCIVTVARGEERSRSIPELLDEIRALRLAHYQELVLTGVHLGGYGSDQGTTLRDLIAAILQRTDVPRLRLGSLEPWDLPAGFFSLWQDPRLCPHLHLPLQSGSDTVLKRMARRCTTQRYRELIAEARETIPNLNVTTDLIVGFPGETGADFEQTLSFAEEIQFGHIHAFAYSPRAGTAAARMRGGLTRATRAARSAQLRALSKRLKATHLATAVGRTATVLWERSTRRLPDGRWIGSGYTPDYLRVEAHLPENHDLYNRFVDARLVRISDDGERLFAIPVQ
ncbi:MAG: radical SAM protein, partial [Myxococcota bacterium]